eukprot:gene10609-66805_t
MSPPSFVVPRAAARTAAAARDHMLADPGNDVFCRRLRDSAGRERWGAGCPPDGYLRSMNYTVYGVHDGGDVLWPWEVCPPGTRYENHSTSLEFHIDCFPCDAGSYSDAAGADACTLCPGGEHQPARNETGCVPCPVGTGVTLAAPIAAGCAAAAVLLEAPEPPPLSNSPLTPQRYERYERCQRYEAGGCRLSGGTVDGVISQCIEKLRPLILEWNAQAGAGDQTNTRTKRRRRAPVRTGGPGVVRAQLNALIQQPMARVPFADVRAGMRVRMVPEAAVGGWLQREPYEGTVAAKGEGSATVRWAEPAEGGPPETLALPRMSGPGMGGPRETEESRAWWGGDVADPRPSVRRSPLNACSTIGLIALRLYSMEPRDVDRVMGWRDAPKPPPLSGGHGDGFVGNGRNDSQYKQPNLATFNFMKDHTYARMDQLRPWIKVVAL